MSFTQEEARDMANMINAAYEVVELFGYKSRNESPYNEKWAKEWCQKALRYGAIPE